MLGITTKKTKLKRFLEVLGYYGEFFYSFGDVKTDYNYITNILKSQGYWSGTNYRFYFDNNLKLKNVEGRW